MKKIVLLLLLFVALSSTAHSQNEAKNSATPIQCQIDSVMKKYDVKGVSITAANGISIAYTTDFYFENGFLVVQKLSFFNMQKLVSFQLFKGLFDKKYGMLIIFN
jgi:hypothetical protein